MKAVLETLKDDWFDVSLAPDQPGGWLPKPALAQFSDSLKKDKLKADKDLAEPVAKKAKALLAAGDEDHSLPRY